MCFRCRRRLVTALTIPSLGTIRHLFHSLHPLTCPALLRAGEGAAGEENLHMTRLFPFHSIPGSSHGFREEGIRATE